MKKIISLLSFLLIVICGYAQERPFFLLQSDATFKTPEGKEFIVIEDEGKTQKELFDFYLQRAYSNYRSFTPEEVLATRPLVDNIIEGSSFTINSYVTRLAETAGSISIRLLGKYWGCSYSFSVQFKDGKIRINAPSITRVFYERASTSSRFDSKLSNFNKWAKSCGDFKKDGTPNPKNPFYISVNNRMSEEINKLLQTSQNEDW